MAYLATFAFAVVILGLFALESDRRVRTSKALWIPTLWVLIAASRSVTQWWHPEPVMQTVAQYMEGSPADRLILSGLLFLGIVVVLCRWKRVGTILQMNWPIVLYFTYCAASVLWSDYPGIALKRWVRAVGDLVMILIVLTDRDRLGAIKRLLTRLSFLLIPLSVLFIEYYPSLGQVYSLEDAKTANTGVTLNKNQLGSLCLIVGLASLWRLALVFRENSHRTRKFIAHGTILIMVVWLLCVANSATSLACFLLGSAVIFALVLPGRARSTRVHFVTGAVACAGLAIVALAGVFPSVVHALGRNTSLTGRTEVWHAVLTMHTNPWIGTGYMTFWLGARLQSLWSLLNFYAAEAHNGYLEIYLNLGWIGVALLMVILVVGYRNVVRAFRDRTEEGIFQVAIFLVALVYNISEAAFRENIPLWIFLLLAIAVPPLAYHRKSSAVEEPVDADILMDHQLVGGPSGYEELA